MVGYTVIYKYLELIGCSGLLDVSGLIVLQQNARLILFCLAAIACCKYPELMCYR